MSFPTTATMQRLLSQYGVIYLPRGSWGHTAPLGPTMPGYARGIHVHHSVTIVDDDHDYAATEDVAAYMREIERIGVKRFGRFPYSFCIHPSGVVAEGAGFTIGAHTANYNSSSFGVCMIGNYERDPLLNEMVHSFKALVTVLRVTDAATDDCYIAKHRDRKATACPGAHTVERWGELIDLSSIPVPATGTPSPQPAPSPTPNPQPASPTQEYDMDTLDLRYAHQSPVRGRHVDNLQALLIATWAVIPGIRQYIAGMTNGFHLPDGIAGAHTKGAVIEFQRFVGITADAVVGPITWRKLIEF